MNKIRDENMCNTGPQEKRLLLGYFKTHCDHTYGGIVWLKLLIALGGVPHDAVDAANRVISMRVQFKENRWATTDPRESTSHHFHSRAVRDSMSDPPRASTPGHGNTEPETHPRVLRREAHALKKEFERDKNRIGDWWKKPKLAREFAQRDAEITQKMSEADKASEKHGFPFKDSRDLWRNMYPSGPMGFLRGLPPMVLDGTPVFTGGN